MLHTLLFYSLFVNAVHSKKKKKIYRAINSRYNWITRKKERVCLKMKKKKKNEHVNKFLYDVEKIINIFLL